MTDATAAAVLPDGDVFLGVPDGFLPLVAEPPPTVVALPFGVDGLRPSALPGGVAERALAFCGVAERAFAFCGVAERALLADGEPVGRGDAERPRTGGFLAGLLAVAAIRL